MTNDDRDKPSQFDDFDGTQADAPISVESGPGKKSLARESEVPTAPLPRQLVIIGVIAAVLVGMVLVTKSHAKTSSGDESSGSALNPNQQLVSKAAAAVIALKTERVTLEPGKRVIETNGVVHFSPNSTINVSPRLIGRVRDVFVKIGDHITASTPLATMVSSDAANAVGTVRDADEQLTLTTTALASARKQFVMGTPEVTSAEATSIEAHENVEYTKRMLDLTREQNGIGGFTDKPLTDAQSAAKQAETQLAQDLKDLALDQTQRERAAKLFGYGVGAKADVEIAENTLAKQQDAVANDREQLRIAQVTLDREERAFKTKLYSNQSVRQAETTYQQAVIQERAAGTAVQMAKAALLRDLKQAEHDFRVATADAHAARTVLSTYDNPTAEGLVVVLAPASGIITAKNVNPGQIVDQTGQTPWQMFTIVNSAVVYVDAQIYEKDMIGVNVGERVTATSDVLPAHFVASGVVSYVSPGLDPATHALSVRAELDNQSGLLKDGMFVSTSLSVGESAFASLPIVPLTAVVHDGDNDYVFIATAPGKYERRQVTLGDQRGEDRVVITKGLTGNETIVTHGALYLGTGGTVAD